MQRSAVILVVSLVGGMAWATPPICDSALALRVNQRGLDFVVDQVKPLIPNKLDIPPISQVVVDWPLTDSDATAHIAGGSASIKLHQLLAQMDGGALRVQGKADVVTQSPVLVDNPYLGLGQANCEADVQLRDLSIDLALQLVTQGGKIQAVVNHANISFNNDTTVIALKGCTLGKILTAVVNFVRKYFMGVVQSQVEKIAKDKISVLLTEKLDETIELTKEVQGFVFTGRLDELNTDAAGVSVGLGLGVGLKQSAAPPCLAGADLTAPTSCVGVPVHLSAQVDAMFGAGLSEAVVNQGLHAVWRSGMLCITSADPRLATVAQGLEHLASSLGQPKGTKLGFALRLLEPPRVRMTLAGGLVLVLNKVSLSLSLTPPTGPAGEVGIDTSLMVGGIPWIDPGSNMLTLDLRQVAIGQLELRDKGGEASPLQLDPARLQRFISTVAMPVLRQRLASMPLTASVVSVQTFQVELKSVQVKDGFVAAYVDGHALKPTGDKSPPETLLLQGPPPQVGPQVVRFTVAGQDNLTPSALLQFRANVDGGEWTEPSYGGWIDVTVHGGSHLIQVAAVDHDGNIDPSPLAVTLLVDDVMPQLAISSRPDSLVTSDAVELGFDGRDDRTPPEQLRFTVELYRVPDGGGMPELVRSVSVPALSRSVRLEDLTDGVYKARVIVADGVGNVTSQDVGFVVAAEAGCSMARQTSCRPLLPLLMLALLGVVLISRARG